MGFITFMDPVCTGRSCCSHCLHFLLGKGAKRGRGGSGRSAQTVLAGKAASQASCKHFLFTSSRGTFQLFAAYDSRHSTDTCFSHTASWRPACALSVRCCPCQAAAFAVQPSRGLRGGPLLCRWVPPPNRGKAISVIYAASSCGTVLGLMATPFLAQLLGGWPACFIFFAGLGVIWAVSPQASGFCVPFYLLLGAAPLQEFCAPFQAQSLAARLVRFDC